MLVPADPSGMDYGAIFAFEVAAALDGSRVADDNTAEKDKKKKANRLKRKNQRKLKEEEKDIWALEGDEDAAANSMGFSWELQSHLARELEIQLVFEKPEMLSSTNYGQD